MRRLLEDESLLDSPDMHLAELFRAASPYRIDRFRKRRVSVHLERAPVRSARQFWLRPVVAAALLVSGTAAAALGHRYAAQSFGILGLANARKPRATSAAPTTLRPTAALGATPNVVEAALQPADEPALTIEAAAARHDPRVADYAQRYLAAYPNGKYRALATRALEISR